MSILQYFLLTSNFSETQAQKKKTQFFFFFLKFFNKTSFTIMALPTQTHPPFAVEIDLPLYVKDHTYAPEPPMDEEGKRLWYRSTVIPYILTGKVNALMSPLPKYIKKTQVVKDFFPTYLDYEPLVFVDKPFNFNFFTR